MNQPRKYIRLITLLLISVFVMPLLSCNIAEAGKTNDNLLIGIPPAYKYLDTNYEKIVFMYEDFRYRTISKDTVEIIYDTSYADLFDDTRRHITVPETVSHNGKTYTVTSIAEYAFTGHTGQRWTNDWNFDSDKNSGYLELPESVVSIGADAFFDSRRYISEMPGVTYMGFQNQTPNIIDDIIEAQSEEEFVIHNGIMLRYNGSDANVIIPEGVTQVSWGVLKASEIEPYTDLEDITPYAYLESITFPKSVTHFDFNIYFLRHLSNIYNDDFIIINDILVRYNGSDSEVIIPEGVVAIADNAFIYCIDITKVTIPEGVISIGRW